MAKSIYEVLESEHRSLRQLIEQARDAGDEEEREELIEELGIELVAHSKAESATLYQALRERGASGIADQAEREHREVTGMLERLDHLSDDDEIQAALVELDELVENHVDEEESMLFDRARELLPDGEEQDLGARFQEEKRAWLDEGLAAIEDAEEEVEEEEEEEAEEPLEEE